MYILAVDTASNAGGVALSRNGEVIGLYMAKTPLRYSEKLISWVDFLLAEHGLSAGEIDRFAVAAGPGSFTGLRIGVAAVKAFAQVLGRPAVGISSLEALAYRFHHISDRVAPVVDARRQQVYGGLFSVGPKGAERIESEKVGRPEEWLRSLPAGDHLFVGDGAVLYRSTILNIFPEARLVPSDNCVLAELCQLACLKSAKGLESRPESIKANYLRPPDVQMGATVGQKATVSSER